LDVVTLAALIAIIALAAGGLIVVMLAIAHVERIDDASLSSTPPPRRQATVLRSGADPALRDMPSRRKTPEAATGRVPKPPRRPAWQRITQAWTSWRHGRTDDLLYILERRGRRGLYEGWAGFLAAVAFSVLLASLIGLGFGYLIAHA
jgi:hypothetical protein